MSKAADAFRTISEVADELAVPKHVLRFWEVKFPQIKPMKRGGGRRYYRPEDVQLLRAIHRLLHGDGYTIRGVQKKLRAEGVERVKEEASGTPIAASTGKRAGRAASKPAATSGRRQAAGIDTRQEMLRTLLSTLADLRADLQAAAAPKPASP